jgi:hypothetical protein
MVADYVMDSEHDELCGTGEDTVALYTAAESWIGGALCRQIPLQAIRLI